MSQVNMPNPNPKLSNLNSYKPKWKSGKTRTIRVPIAIADRVLEVAHQIDDNISHDTSDISNLSKSDKSQSNQVNNSNFITDTSDKEREKIKQILSEALRIKSNQGAKIKRKISELGKYFGWKIEKANRKADWSITDTSE